MCAVDYAVIGGTGVYNPDILGKIEEKILQTRYGEALVKMGELQGKKIAFLARHGSKHSVPPHAINYRANIMALKNLGVKKILATAAVGSLNIDMKPGDFVLLDQFIDFTKGREKTFYEGGKEGVLHIDLTEPYCPELRNILIKCSPPKIVLHKSGTYVCTEGPRFETPAEIKMFAQWGGDLVGMTNVPEVVLAREAGICYATVAMVTNFAAGISPNPLTHQEVLDTMQKNTENLQNLIMRTLEALDCVQGCSCSKAFSEAGNLG